MDRAGMAALRWLGALVVLGLIVFVSLRLLVGELETAIVFGSDAPTEVAGGTPTPQPEAPPTEPVTDDTTQSIADFVVQGQTVAQAGSPIAQISSPDGLVVLAFPRIDGDPRCIDHVRLDAVVSADAPVQLGVWGSTLSDATSMGDGATVEPPLRLSEQPRAVAATQGTEGFLPWNLTELYREYVRSSQVPAEAPFVVALRPITGEAPAVRIATGDAGSDRAPRLTWLGVPGCGAGSATETPTAPAG